MATQGKFTRKLKLNDLRITLRILMIKRILQINQYAKTFRECVNKSIGTSTAINCDADLAFIVCRSFDDTLLI